MEIRSTCKSSLKIEIETDPDEIVALAIEVQKQLSASIDTDCIAGKVSDGLYA